MKREEIFSMPSPFRDTFRIQGFRFGFGEKSLAIVGAMRGDEIQQQYICSQVVRQLVQIEEAGCLVPGHEILVIPSANPYSMNIEKRFWAMDNTDINRMFPGYDQGETTQRIAAAVFGALEGYKYGVQMASYYIPGDFIPHVRMIRTGYEDVETAKLFGMPYVCLRKPLPFDTTLLNYNWQIWGTKAYSIYAGQNHEVEGNKAVRIVRTLLRFMHRTGIINYPSPLMPGYKSQVIDEADLLTVKAPVAGILNKLRSAREQVEAGETLAVISDAYTGECSAEIKAPSDGIIFFAHNKPLAMENTPLFKILV